MYPRVSPRKINPEPHVVTMRSVKNYLIVFCAAFPGVLGRLATGAGKDVMHLGIPILPGLLDDLDDPEPPVSSESPVVDTTEAPVPEPTDPPPSETSEVPAPDPTPATNPIIESITWQGTGCPARAGENETASVQVQLEEDGSFGVYTFNNFDAYLGWSETQEVETEAACTISMEIAGIPEGWSFQIQEVRAEGYIYLVKGATAFFNSTVFWSGDGEHVVSLPNTLTQALAGHSPRKDQTTKEKLTLA